MDAKQRRSLIYTRMAMGETVHTTSLAQEFDVTERTIQNDINELKLSADIVSDKKGYYRFKRIPKPIDEEMREIVKALLCSLSINTFPEFLSEIHSILGFENEHFVFDTQSEPIENIYHFKTILMMINWNYSVEIDYKDKKRTVHPFKIANLNNYWYLIAYDLKECRLKSFLINKIKSVNPIYDNLFGNEKSENEIRKKLKIKISPWIKEESNEAEIIIYAPLNETLKRKMPLNTELIEHNEEYSIIKLHYYDEREAINFASKYIPYIKFNNESLNNTFKEHLLKTVELCE